MKLLIYTILSLLCVSQAIALQTDSLLENQSVSVIKNEMPMNRSNTASATLTIIAFEERKTAELHEETLAAQNHENDKEPSMNRLTGQAISTVSRPENQGKSAIIGVMLGAMIVSIYLLIGRWKG
jgi:hypothetical protein